MWHSFAEAFSFPFMRNALWGSLLIGIISSIIGVYVVLRRIAFLGIGLAQVSSLGVAIATYFGLNKNFLSLLLVLLCLLLLVIATRGKEKVPKEALIGVIYSFALALSLLFLSKSAKGEAGVMESLFGNLLAIHKADIRNLAIVFLPIALVYILFNKEITATSFDAETSRAMGLNTRLWDFVFYFTVGIVIAYSTRLSGVFFSFSMLVIPPFIALLSSRSLGSSFIISLLVTIPSVILGLYFSYIWDFPPSGMIVALLFVFLLLATLIARR
ncbi:metal ABC transporter permease [bacterium]|nr:metal ABC transporter permease [bacterium]